MSITPAWRVSKGLAESLVPLLQSIEADLKDLEGYRDDPNLMKAEARVLVVRQLLDQHIHGLNLGSGRWEAIGNLVGNTEMAATLVRGVDSLRQISSIIQNVNTRKSRQQNQGGPTSTALVLAHDARLNAPFTSGEIRELLEHIDVVSKSVNVLGVHGLSLS